MRFLNLIVEMLLITAARLSFEDIEGAHVVQVKPQKQSLKIEHS